MSKTVRRRFLQVGERRVHYFRAGDGPPVVLVHSSPANARLLMKEIARLSGDYTVFAFDTPGFGLSQPLELQEMIVADLADALAETLAAIGMPACPVFGTHTGAAIALEFGVRHPDRVTGLVLDGVPAFNADECAYFFRDYFRTLPVDDLGSHYSAAWTRFRDQAIWFPWCERVPANLNEYDLSPPASTHLWVWMYFEAADHYAPAYRAASFYGDRAIAAAAELTVPAIFTATTTDMLHPHLERLPPLAADQQIRDIGDSYQRKRELVAESFARFRADVSAPADRDAIASSADLARQFVDGSQGQIHLRYQGRIDAAPLVLIHDAPGSSEQVEQLIGQLAADFFVIAPDLPGHGESDPLDAPTLAAFADEVVTLLDGLGVDKAVAYGVGFGSSVAAEIGRRHSDRISALVLSGAALPEAEERRELRANLAPPIAIEPDGAHWYRTWLMLRDSQVYWPWYDRSLKALRRIEADFGAARMHRWTLDVMRGRDSYNHLIHAALDGDTAAAISAFAGPVVFVNSFDTPLAVYAPRLQALRPNAPAIDAADVGRLLALTLQSLRSTPIPLQEARA